MADLTARSAAGIAPSTIGTVTLSEAQMRPIWAIAPYRGQTDALSSAMQAAHGMGFPAPGEMTRVGGTSIAWSGINQAFLIGAVPDASLSQYAALTDQSDAWCHLVLEGARIEAVLARLAPVDMSAKQFPPGSATRSGLGHMASLFLRISETQVDVLIFRSMAATACHELTRAMRSIAARAV